MVTKNSLCLWPWCYDFLFHVSSTCSASTERMRGVVQGTDGGHSITVHGWGCVHVLLTRGAVRRATTQREELTCIYMPGN